MPIADRTLQLIDATLTATEAPAMTDQPRTDDRIPLRTELSTAGRLAQAQVRIRDLEALCDRLTATVAGADTERDQALAQITDAWAALNAAGYAHPVASVADLIRQCAADRDAAVSQLNHTRTTAHDLEVDRDDLRIQLHRAEAEARAMVRDRNAVIVERDQARAQLAAARADTHRDIARQIRILVDDPTVLRWWLDTCDPTPTGYAELLGHLAEKIGRGDDAQAPGSAPARVQGDDPEPPPGAVPVTQAEQIDLLGGALDATRRDLARVAAALTREEQGHAETAADRDQVQEMADRLAAGLGAVVRTMVEHGHPGEPCLRSGWVRVSEVNGWQQLLGEYTALAEGRAPESIRPADWEQRAITAARDALAGTWRTIAAIAVAEVAVRAIIDAGLAGAGGRCAGCGATTPRTPRAAGSLCWTCATEDQTGLAEPDPAALAEHQPAVARVLDGIRADRAATLAQIERDAAQHQAAVLAGTVQDEMTPAYPATSPANTREG
ncbi:hypothetical protein AB0M91_19670 [Micromonospora rifamycinica]|uniref:hypothetical protein n=1 Tax=Micromonospora rifamycinica TaxID=291594 RepID=UPI00342B6DC0